MIHRLEHPSTTAPRLLSSVDAEVTRRRSGQATSTPPPPHVGGHHTTASKPHSSGLQHTPFKNQQSEINSPQCCAEGMPIVDG